MSEKPSGTRISAEAEIAYQIMGEIMDIVDKSLPPSVYLAALSVALGAVAAQSNILPEELDERVFNPIRKAFEVSRKVVLTVPEAREKIEARQRGEGDNTIH